MIGVIDYGCGNVGSVLNMLSKAGIWGELVDSPEKIASMRALILPGVGSFDTGAKGLRDGGFWEPIRQHVEADKKPILGICLGMQLLFSGSEEGLLPGFGWLPGTVTRFGGPHVTRVPHIGWQTLTVTPAGQALFGSIAKPEYYFVHAYHAPVNLPAENVAAYSRYGYDFPAAVQKGNVAGVQFHPEKSLGCGMDLFKKFAATIQ